MQIPFVKTHNAGNDFVMIAKDKLPIIANLQDFILQLTDRHFGIGCDQLIFYQRQEDYYSMEIYNPDASAADFCGNATICLMNFLHRLSGLTKIVIKTKAQKVSCWMEDNNLAATKIDQVAFEVAWMPTIRQLRELERNHGLKEQVLRCVDVGNKHLVLLSNNLNSDQYKGLGSSLSNHPLFPEGINISFCNIQAQHIELRVWERGAGLTLACGSGACASFALAHQLGLVQEQVEVKFSRGSLLLNKSNDSIIMKGKAQLVGKGEYYG